MTMQSLPLDTLILSKLNVRHTERDADIAALADDIAARGLKQNLVVIPAMASTGEAESGWDNKWEVIAGGRRYQAMQLLVADGRLPADHPVACLLEERDDASETSLSENLHKVAMNPADEFAAFKAIVDQRMSPKHNESENAAVAYTAKRFGATIRYVEGRLRLASLCDEVLDALREGMITLDIAKAYAGTTDHTVQRTVFNAAKKTPYTLSAKDIRNRLRGVTCPLDDHRMQFVGQVAYRAAGGRIETEMFMGSEGELRVVDVVLLEKLANEKGGEAAKRSAKADGWKDGLFALSSAYTLKKPEGFTLIYHSADQVAKKKRKTCIAIYTNRGDDLELEAYFEPAAPAEPVQERDWAAEHRQREREEAITTHAARMTVPTTVGTPLEGRAFWPKYNTIRPCDDDGIYVVMLIKVPNTDIETNRAEATRLIDEEAAAEAERAEDARIAQLAQDHPDHVKPIADADDQDDGADELTTDEAEA